MQNLVATKTKNSQSLNSTDMQRSNIQNKRKAGKMFHVLPISQFYDLSFDILVNLKQEYEYDSISTEISKGTKQKHCGILTNK